MEIAEAKHHQFLKTNNFAFFSLHSSLDEFASWMSETEIKLEVKL